MTTPTPEQIEAGREGIAERMTWASLHWGKISPDAYQHLATAALFAAAPLIAAQAKVEALREVGTQFDHLGKNATNGAMPGVAITWLNAADYLRAAARAATLEGEN